MILAQRLHTINSDYIFISSGVSNAIIEAGLFYRIMYAHPCATANGIYIAIKQCGPPTAERHYNKIVYVYTITEADAKVLCQIEVDILNKMDMPNKQPDLKMPRLVQSGTIRVNTGASPREFTHTTISADADTSCTTSYGNCNAGYIMLKINGVWESNTQYGIMYKFTDQFQSMPSI